MRFQHLLHVFRKDSLEILRDRRTLFVNIILPALLYPFIALFMLQVIQLTKAQQRLPKQLKEKIIKSKMKKKKNGKKA